MGTVDGRTEAQERAKAYNYLTCKKYRHFKGNVYEVLAIGVHSETAELMVIYRSAQDYKLWVRPLDMFLSEVDHEQYPDVKQKMRFEPLDEA